MSHKEFLRIWHESDLCHLCTSSTSRLAQSTIQLQLPVAHFPAPRFQFVLQSAITEVG